MCVSCRLRTLTSVLHSSAGTAAPRCHLDSVSNWGNKVLPCSLHPPKTVSLTYLFLSTSLGKFNGIQEADIRPDRQSAYTRHRHRRSLFSLLDDRTPNVNTAISLDWITASSSTSSTYCSSTTGSKPYAACQCAFTMPWRVPRMLNLRHYSVV